MNITNPLFQRIHDDYNEMIRRYLTRLVCPDAADDLTQVVFRKASEALDGFRGETQLSTWLYRIATNTALDALRSDTLKHSVTRIEFDETGSDNPDTDSQIEPVGSMKIPGNRVVHQQIYECIRNYINRLPENYRSILVLSDLEGLAVSEVAEVTGIAVETVKSRLQSARAKLRDELLSSRVFSTIEQDVSRFDLKTVFDAYKLAENVGNSPR